MKKGNPCSVVQKKKKKKKRTKMNLPERAKGKTQGEKKKQNKKKRSPKKKKKKKKGSELISHREQSGKLNGKATITSNSNDLPTT